MRKDLKRNLYILVASITVAVFSFRAVASTLASAQGPVFQGSVTAPGLNLSTAVTTTQCVGDGGFTQCLGGIPQTLAVNQLQLQQCTAGPGANCVLTGAAPSPNDGGAQLPGLSASSILVATPVLNDAVHPTFCNVTLSTYFMDGGDAVIACTPDAGLVNVLRLN